MKKLLVVDDEDVVLTALKRYFELSGYEVDCAREREEACALLTHVRYDCAIVDLNLNAAHGADGLDVVAYARARRPSIRVVVFTGFPSPDRKTEARRLGADAVLEKATPLPEVSRLVTRLVANGSS